MLVAAASAQQTLEVSRSEIIFTAPRGGDAPLPQFAALTSDITERTPFVVTVRADVPGGAGWLRVTPSRGTSPARLQFSADQTGLATGGYTARVMIGAGSREIPVEVVLWVIERAPSLSIAPESLRFTYSPVDSAEQFLFIRNAGGGGAMPFQVSALAGGDWLSVDPPSGAVAPNQPGVVRVSIDRARARATDYGLLRIAAAGQAVEVPVTAVQEGTRPILGLNLTGLRFEARQGEGHANNRNVLVLNLGQGSLNWEAEVLRGTEWLSLGSTRGEATPEEFGRLGLNVEPGELSPGPYYALVRVTAPGAANSPQYIGGVLNVSAAIDSPAPDPSPQGLFFVGDPSEPPPQNQPIRVFTSSRTPVEFQASASTADGANWLRVQPESGVTSTGAVTTLRVTVAPGAVEPGVYSGEVTVAFADRSIRTTNVTLVAAEGAEAAAPPSSNARAATAACSPSRLSLTHTGLVNSFLSTAGWPTPLIVRLADDCGGPVRNASVVATFSNGDPPLAMYLTNAQVGLYSATWLPRAAGDAVVTATASAPELGTSRADILGGVTESRQAPLLFPGAVMNAFHPVPGAPVAPGTPVQVFGEHLSAVAAAAAESPLPVSLADVSLVIGGVEAPLFYVSPGQVNAQIPPGLEANSQHAAVILSGNRYTVADPVVVTATGPAVIGSGGVAFAQRGDSTLVSAASPARPGEEITILASGLGATSPAIAAGDVPPDNVSAQARISPRVIIGGREAALRSASLSRDMVGVYRVTVRVPSELPDGAAPLAIEQEGVVSNQMSIAVGR
jgi:uncharacterized protein (TIGR03437 family)